MSTNKLSKVHKSNDLNQANFNDFSLSTYRVFLNLLTKIQRYDTNGNLISLYLTGREYSLCAKEYSIEFNISQNLAYGILKTAVDKLLKTSYSISLGKNILKVNICSRALYAKDEGRIDIKFTEDVLPYLAALSEQFTMYNLNEIAGFNSIYTTRLYELIVQYKTTGYFETTVEGLRFSLGCAEIFKQYNHFKNRAFRHAVDEINSQFTINLNYEEVKNGRTVEKIIFTFKKTTQTKAYDPIRQKMRTQLIRPKRKANPNN